MAAPPPDPLLAALRQELDRASERALAGAHLDADTLARLEALARLVELRASAAARPRRRRWPLAVALVVTMLLVSILVFARVGETAVELDVVVSEAAFAMARSQVLVEGVPLVALGASGLEAVELPAAAGSPRLLTRHVGAVRLAVDGAGDDSGRISLAPITLGSSSRVRLRRLGRGRYSLELAAADLELQADVSGTVRVGWPETPPGPREFGTPRSIRLIAGPDAVALYLTVPAAEPVSFASQLRVSELSFARIEEHDHAEMTLLRRLSTILSGTLYQDSLNGKVYPLRAGESLSFASVDGVIRALQLQDDRIALQFHGRVRGMCSLAGAYCRSLMPSYLEWIQARHGLGLFWGATLYLFGLCAGLMRWWGGPV